MFPFRKIFIIGLLNLALMLSVFVSNNVNAQEINKVNGGGKKLLDEELEKQNLEADIRPFFRRWKNGEEFNGEILSAYTQEKWIEEKDSPWVRVQIFTLDLNNDGKKELIFRESCGWFDEKSFDVCLTTVYRFTTNSNEIILMLPRVKSFEVKNTGVDFLDIEFERINDECVFYKEIYRFDGMKYKLIK